MIDSNALAIIIGSHDSNAIAAFSLRSGGCSPAPFDSLNFSSREGDSPENVDRNLETFCKHSEIAPHKLLASNQVHGDTIRIIETASEGPGNADAMITARSGLYLGIKTADCLPILILDSTKKLAAAVHAGWQGTVLRITGKTMEVLKKQFGCDPLNLKAILGPCIGPCCYEVDDRVLDPFRKNIPNGDSFIVEEQQVGRHLHAKGSRPNGVADLVVETDIAAVPLPSTRPVGQSYRVDLAGANRAELISGGIPEENIVSANLCTACYPELFFSHRRDKGETGRHMAVVGFRT
ncbi:peptidoglycan editing factor PgeF [Thermodesulfobacteriota bacterium]